MVQILLTRIALEERLPLGLLTDQADYDVWFKVKVQEVLDDKTSTVSHKEVVGEIQDLISRKRNASSWEVYVAQTFFSMTFLLISGMKYIILNTMKTLYYM